MSRKIEGNNWKIFLEILKDPERKSILRMIFEFFYLFILYKELPSHYIGRFLFKKGTTNIKGYLPNRYAEKIVPRFNDKRFREVLDNKLYFDLYYRQFNIKMPEILMYNHKNIFMIKSERTEVKNIGDFTGLLEMAFEKDVSRNSIFIKKNYASSGGSNTYKLRKEQLRKDPELIGKIYSEIVRSEFVFQEVIRQHQTLNDLNPSCINTIRIDTFIDRDGNAAVISAYLRMSLNNLHIDNISLGGCMVGIDINTGKLNKIGYPNIRSHGVKLISEHPVTGIKFEDLSIPFFPEVKEMVIKAAHNAPGLRLIGWDVAIGESGPVLIEGNSDYGLTGNDLAVGGYLTDKGFKKVMEEIKN